MCPGRLRQCLLVVPDSCAQSLIISISIIIQVLYVICLKLKLGSVVGTFIQELNYLLHLRRCFVMIVTYCLQHCVDEGLDLGNFFQVFFLSRFLSVECFRAPC